MSNLLFVLVLLGVCQGNPCTQMCDQSPQVPNSYQFNACGLDLEDHVNIDPNRYYCYLVLCNISFLYPGGCNCPNDCSSILNRGLCLNQSCQCSDGWGGRDCSSIRCPSNCGGNGQCLSDPKVGDYCKCNPGWVGPNCDIAFSPKLNRSKNKRMK